MRNIIIAAAAIAVFTGSSSMAEAATSEICGAPIKSIVRTNKVIWKTTSMSFANVPGTGMNIVVPAGQKQCVKIRFSAAALCSEEKCQIRAVASNIQLDPGNVPFSMNSGPGNTGGAYSFEWIKRLDPGTYQVRMQGSTGGPNDFFEVGPWTMHVEITN